MARLSWNKAGERYFEAGVDRGVLYPQVGQGVAWSGLISVSENPIGGESSPHYIDGVKYHNEQTSEEYAATITAFTFPDEFARADGLYSASNENGFYVDNQPRESFGLSYRSLKGNDVQSTEYGYKIHLVYNAMTSANTKDRLTLDRDPEALNFVWPITTTPVIINGHRRSAHFIIDSNEMEPLLLGYLEGILYGRPGRNPRLPTPNEIVEIINTYVPSGYGYGLYGHTTYGHGNEYK